MPRRGRRPRRADASFDSILRDPGFGVTTCAAAAGVDTHQTPNAHLPGTALRADASFDSILRYPGFDVTACAAAVGVDVCAGPCAHVRGSAGPVRQEDIARISEVTGMPEDEVKTYSESNSHLDAERLKNHMRDIKFEQLKPNAATTERQMSETEASFFRDTSYTVNYLLSLSALERQAIVQEWLSAQTGYTVPEVANKIDFESFGKDVYELLRHLQAEKRISLVDMGIPMDQAEELAKNRENLETIVTNYLHAQGYECVYGCTHPPDAPVARTCYYAFAPACPYAPSPWSGVAPASAGPGVFACVQACKCPPAGNEHCAATCGMGAETAPTNFDVKIEHDESLIGASGMTFKQMFARDNTFYQDLEKFLDSTDLSLIQKTQEHNGKTSTQESEEEKTCRRRLHHLGESLPNSLLAYLRYANINTF